MQARHLPLHNPEATRRLGEQIARAMRRGELLLLSGDLGAGKTTLARGMIQTLAGAAIEVPSPTFILAAPYELEPFPVVHYDLYRLNDASELDELGIEDALEDGVAIVEWPEILDGWLDHEAISIHLTGTDERIAEMKAPGDFLERFDGG